MKKLTEILAKCSRCKSHAEHLVQVTRGFCPKHYAESEREEDELKSLRAEVRRLRRALNEISRLSPTDSYSHSTVKAPGIAKSALSRRAARKGNGKR